MKDPNNSDLMKSLLRARDRGQYDLEKFASGLSLRDAVRFDVDTLCGLIRELQAMGCLRDFVGRLILMLNWKLESRKKGHKSKRVELLTDKHRRPWEPLTIDYVFNTMWQTDSERQFDHWCGLLSEKDGRGDRTDHTARAGMYPVHRKMWGACTRYNGELYAPFADGFCRVDRTGERITYTEHRFLKQALHPEYDGQCLRDEPPTAESVAVVLCREVSDIVGWWWKSGYAGCGMHVLLRDAPRVVYSVGD